MCDACVCPKCHKCTANIQPYVDLDIASNEQWFQTGHKDIPPKLQWMCVTCYTNMNPNENNYITPDERGVRYWKTIIWMRDEYS